MNKTQLVEQVAKRTGGSKAQSAEALEATLEAITAALRKGDEVAITGFGKFSVTKRAVRPGRNPATGQVIKIKASKTPRFSAGATLRKARRGQEEVMITLRAPQGWSGTRKKTPWRAGARRRRATLP